MHIVGVVVVPPVEEGKASTNSRIISDEPRRQPINAALSFFYFDETRPFLAPDQLHSFTFS